MNVQYNFLFGTRESKSEVIITNKDLVLLEPSISSFVVVVDFWFATSNREKISKSLLDINVAAFLVRSTTSLFADKDTPSDTT